MTFERQQTCVDLSSRRWITLERSWRQLSTSTLTEKTRRKSLEDYYSKSVRVSMLLGVTLSSLIKVTGELMLGALVKNQIASLAGAEDDPKRAMMRALFNLALTKFKLSPAHRYAYMNSAKVAGESTTRLWLECTKNIQIEINRQLKSVTAGLMCAFHPLDETTEVPPPAGCQGDDDGRD